MTRPERNARTIAVIGCGAIADSFHLPALTRHAGGSLDLVLVDPDPSRREALAERHGVTKQASSHVEVLDRIDAAVVASPHHTHVPIARDLVAAGVAVLSEKPLGTTVEEVEDLRDLAVRSGVTVAVNQTRRFIPACRRIHEIVNSGSLGATLRIDAREGDRFDWPAATASMFGASAGGRGVVLDIGAHVLDLLTWWLGPDLEVIDYRDDSFGGSEASAMCRLRGPVCTVEVRLSWLQKQRNSYQITGENGRLHWGVYDLDEVTLEDGDGSNRRSVRVRGAPPSFQGLAGLVLEDFLRAVRTGSRPLAGPEEVLPSMRLMQDCYEKRHRFDMPWHHFDMEMSRAP